MVPPKTETNGLSAVKKGARPRSVKRISPSSNLNGNNNALGKGPNIQILFSRIFTSHAAIARAGSIWNFLTHEG
jgi:hypothetical protein